MVELAFSVLGDSLPTDHAYPLYAALSSRLPVIHDDSFPLSIGNIRGTYMGNGRLQLDSCSRLRLRLPPERIPDVLPLAGQSLEVAGNRIRVGVPQVRSLAPASTLVARLVTIKIDRDVSSDETPERFLAAARKLLAAADVPSEATLPRYQDHTRRAGEFQRRVLRIHGQQIIGFALQVSALSDAHSLLLQANWHAGRAIFSRRKLGCGFFVPLRIER